MIANLNIVAKTFAKIAKTFAGLLAMIITTSRRPVLVLHLVEKYAKMKFTQKTKKGAPRLQKVKPNKKVKSDKKVNGQR